MLYESKYIVTERKNNVIYCWFKPCTIDLEAAKEIVKFRLEHYGKKPNCYVLIDEGIKYITKEARDYLNSEEGTKQIKAAAVVLKNPLSKIFANFVFNIKKPLVPIKFFNDLKEAENWIKKYK